MRIRDDVKISPAVRGTSLGNFNTESVGISLSVLSATPVSISTVFVQAEVQAIADAIREVNKLLE